MNSDKFSPGLIVYFVIIFIVIVLIISYRYRDYVDNNWNEMRCYPYVMPFVGFSNNAEGSNILAKGIRNFTFCTTSYLRTIFDVFLKPFIIIIKEIVKSAHNIRVILNRFRHETLLLRRIYSKLIKTSFEKVNNTRHTAIFLHEKMRDMINKHQASLDVLDNIGNIWRKTESNDKGILGDLYNSKGFPSLMSPQLVEKIGSGKDKVNYGDTTLGLGLETCPVACFEGSTEVETFFGKKKIRDVCLGDYIKGGRVTCKIYLNPLSEVDVYKYRGVIVSGSHLVLHDDKWMRVCNIEESIKLNESYPLYCLNTTSNLIYINNIIFRDYQETHAIHINKIINTMVENDCNGELNRIHVLHPRPLYYWGFTGNTLIKVGNSFIPIKDVVKLKYYHYNILGGVELEADGIDIYSIDGIRVSGNTLVKKNRWLRVYEHLTALPSTGENVIYNIFTSDNLVHVKSDRGLFEFRDFAESNDTKLNDKIDDLVESSIMSHQDASLV